MIPCFKKNICTLLFQLKKSTNRSIQIIRLGQRLEEIRYWPITRNYGISKQTVTWTRGWTVTAPWRNHWVPPSPWQLNFDHQVEHHFWPLSTTQWTHGLPLVPMQINILKFLCLIHKLVAFFWSTSWLLISNSNFYFWVFHKCYM